MSKEAAAAILTQTYFQVSEAARKQVGKQPIGFSSPADPSIDTQVHDEVIRVYDAFLSQLAKT
jgi:hypothetical protein